MTTAPAHSLSSFPAEAVITTDCIDSLRSGFEVNPNWRTSQNAITQVGIDDVALNREVVTGTDYSFSTLLDDWKVTNQKQSGRCWMFAALNLFRVEAMKAMNLKQFEFSQNYTLFWDKFERANWFLESIIETSGRDLDDHRRVFSTIPSGWSVEHVRGHRPQARPFPNPYPGAVSWGQSRRHFNWYLRGFAKQLRDSIAAGESVEAARALKGQQLAVIWRISACVWSTSTEFNWQWNDKDREFHRDGVMTPGLSPKYVKIDLDNYACLVNDPRPDSPIGRTFTVEYLGNVMEENRSVWSTWRP